jgi:hypothetical protein
MVVGVPAWGVLALAPRMHVSREGVNVSAGSLQAAVEQESPHFIVS